MKKMRMKQGAIFTAIGAFLIATLLGSSAMASGTQLVIADFNTGDKPSTIGSDFGSWNKDPNDDTQGTTMSFVSDDALGDTTGYSVKLDYDVDSPNPAYNGFWIKLNSIDATPYNTLTFYIKGDQAAGFTKRVKIELKDKSNKSSSYVVGNVTGEWQKVSILFDKFRRINDWTALTEFVIVFDDLNSKPKKGTVYIDQIALVKE